MSSFLKSFASQGKAEKKHNVSAVIRDNSQILATDDGHLSVNPVTQ